MTATAFLALLLATAQAPVQAPADSTPKGAPPRTIAELGEAITKLLDSAKVPGVGLAIVRHDSVIFTGGFGRARVAPEIKTSDTTLFRIGSTSKAFVALTAQALVREGKLRLDQPLSEALPGFEFENAWESTDPVRIVHLLEHTSGFDDNSLKSYANSDPKPLTLAEGLAIDVATRKSRWRPGTHFSYCNTGPAIVALIIERIEGKPFEQVVQERWFTPIGMGTATYFRPDSTQREVATLYKGDGATAVPYWHVFIRPAGSINASAHDMAAYVRFLLGRGSIDGKELLTRDAIERMERSESSQMARAGLAVGYGLHLYRTADSTGFAWMGHNGGVEGGLSDMSYLPTYGVGYAFQINSANGEAFGRIRELVRGFITQGLVPPAPPAVAAIAPATRASFGGWYRSISPRAQHLYPLERIPDIVHVAFTDSTMLVHSLFADEQVFVAVDSLRFRHGKESEATLAFVRDSANRRPEGFEQWVSLGESFGHVSALDAVGSVTIAGLWILGMVLSAIAVVFGAVRWIVRRVRGRPSTPAPSATAWRIAALAALFVAVQFVMLAVGSAGVGDLGNLTLVSATIWLSGILFAIASLAGAVACFRAPKPTGLWQRLSRWKVCGVTTLNVIVACYLVLEGWIGWRTWT